MTTPTPAVSPRPLPADPADLAGLLDRVQDLPLPRAAVLLAEAGVPVFPCVPGGKTPLTRHGFHDATANPRQVAEWWRRWPQANIGMPTGPVSGMDVVDIDRRPGGDGHRIFERVQQQVGADRWMLSVATPSGGTHLYYPVDPTRPQPSWACGSAHVDFRGAGGYVIIPPSSILRAGAAVAYRVTGVQTDAHPVDAHRLRDRLNPRQARSARPIRLPAGTMSADVMRLAAWMAHRPEGERNRSLFWAGCRMAETGHDHFAAVTVLGDAARAAGLPDREIRTTLASAYRAAHPGAATTTPASFARTSLPATSACRAVTL
jgi:hypothetical protein